MRDEDEDVLGVICRPLDKIYHANKAKFRVESRNKTSNKGRRYVWNCVHWGDEYDPNLDPRLLDIEADEMLYLLFKPNTAWTKFRK
jgi:hypothetical protein